MAKISHIIFTTAQDRVVRQYQEVNTLFVSIMIDKLNFTKSGNLRQLDHYIRNRS